MLLLPTLSSVRVLIHPWMTDRFVSAVDICRLHDALRLDLLDHVGDSVTGIYHLHLWSCAGLDSSFLYRFS